MGFLFSISRRVKTSIRLTDCCWRSSASSISSFRWIHSWRQTIARPSLCDICSAWLIWRISARHNNATCYYPSSTGWFFHAWPGDRCEYLSFHRINHLHQDIFPHFEKEDHCLTPIAFAPSRTNDSSMLSTKETCCRVSNSIAYLSSVSINVSGVNQPLTRRTETRARRFIKLKYCSKISPKPVYRSCFT